MVGFSVLTLLLQLAFWYGGVRFYSFLVPEKGICDVNANVSYSRRYSLSFYNYLLGYDFVASVMM
jgi:hypothetical protein